MGHIYMNPMFWKAIWRGPVVAHFIMNIYDTHRHTHARTHVFAREHTHTHMTHIYTVIQTIFRKPLGGAEIVEQFLLIIDSDVTI